MPFSEALPVLSVHSSEIIISLTPPGIFSAPTSVNQESEIKRGKREFHLGGSGGMELVVGWLT